MPVELSPGGCAVACFDANTAAQPLNVGEGRGEAQAAGQSRVRQFSFTAKFVG